MSAARGAVVSGVAVLGLLIGGFGMPSRAALAVRTHAAASCGTGFTVVSPETAQGQLTAQQVNAPARAAFFARASAHHVHWLSALDCRTDSSHTTPLDLTTSTNWSGYTKSTTSPNYADAEWHVPSVSGGGHTAYSSVWPGIGGTTSTGKLIQDGTEQDVTAAGSQTDTFWVEIVPGEAEQTVANLVPRIGDDVATDVYWSRSTGAEFGICDYTQAKCVTGSQASAAPGNSAEWIVERPLVGGVFPRLADFRSVKIVNGGYDESRLGSREHGIFGSAVTMEGSSGDKLAVPGSISSDAFTTTWKASS